MNSDLQSFPVLSQGLPDALKVCAKYQFTYSCLICVFIKRNSFGDQILVKQLLYNVSFIFARFILSFYLGKNDVGKAFYLREV